MLKEYTRKLLLAVVTYLVTLAVVPQLSAQDITEARAVKGGVVTITLKNIPAEDVGNVNGEYPVSQSDGTIALPYLENRLYVAGKTARQVEEMVQSQYVSQKIYNQPIVQASVASKEEAIEAMTRYVMVTGYVGSKRNLRYRKGMTLIEALLECGDITDFGSRRIQVTRKNITRTYDYFSARDRDLKLQPDDKIYVQKRGVLEGRPASIGP